jgi:hypothetical protein
MVNSVFEVLGLISAVFAIVMPKPSFKPYTRPGAVTPWHRFLIQRIYHHMLAVAPEDIAAIISDEYGREKDAELAIGITNFLFKLPEGQQYTNVLETPLFVSSNLCPGIQIADIFAYIGRQYFCHDLDRKRVGLDKYELWIRRLWEHQIKPKSPDYTDSKNLVPGHSGNYSGIYKMPLDAYEQEP